MNVDDRFQRLRTTLCVNWRELSERLEISQSMLFQCLKGTRNPSPKMLRRIVELETEAGLRSSPVSNPMLVRDPPIEYPSSVEQKHIDIRALRQQITDLKRQVASMEKLLEDADR